MLFPRGDFQSLKIVARVSVFAGLLVPLMPKNSPSKPVDTGGPDLENVRPSGGVPEWPKGSDCKSDAKASEVRILPPPPDKKQIILWMVCMAGRLAGIGRFAGIVQR